MADVTFTKTNWGSEKTPKGRYYTAVIDGTDTDTETLIIDPLKEHSITINHGGTDALVIQVANDELGENLVDISDASGNALTFSVDTTVTLEKGYSALKIGTASVEHTINILAHA